MEVGGKGLLGSGVEYCGICLNGVREVLRGTMVPVRGVIEGGYYCTCLKGLEL